MQVAIIGACGANAHNHIRAYKKLGIKISAIVDVSERGKELAKELDAEFYSDYRKIDASIAELASVSLPPYLHTKVCSYLLSKGINVLCEKPVSLTVKEGEILRDIIHSSGKVLMVGFCLRFAEKFIKFKRLIEDGKMGNIIHINSRFSAMSRFKGDWRADPQKGGGLCLVNRIHSVDLATWLTGQKVESIDAYGDSSFHQQMAEDNCIILLRHKNGCITTISGHYWPFKKTIVGFEVIGTKALAIFEDNNIILNKENSEEERIEFADNDMYYAEVKHFIECVVKGNIPQCGLEESLQATAIIEKAKLSMVKRERI